MASAINPEGAQKYWSDGLPHGGLLKEDEGSEKYWSDGLPSEFLYPRGITKHPIIFDLLAGKFV